MVQRSHSCDTYENLLQRQSAAPFRCHRCAQTCRQTNKKWQFPFPTKKKVVTESSCTRKQKVKGKLVSVLFLNLAPCHEGELGEWRYSSMHSLTSALDEGEWLASRSGRFTLSERDSGAHWIEGWVGPKAVLDAVVKRKIPSPRRESNPRTPIIQPVA
jgi:hypothetical protein